MDPENGQTIKPDELSSKLLNQEGSELKKSLITTITPSDIDEAARLIVRSGHDRIILESHVIFVQPFKAEELTDEDYEFWSVT